MPVVQFQDLPASARVWVFASDRPLTGDDSKTLLREVRLFLAQWNAHGHPLRCASEWRDDRFLVIGVDPTAEQASGCSIDGLFRGLQTLERVLHTKLVAGGRVFYRDASGVAQLAQRPEIEALASKGALTTKTPVFDLSLTAASDYRARFERPAGETWVAALLPA